MYKVSGYVVENSQGGYDVIAKKTQANSKPFVIPAEESANTQKTGSNNPFEASTFNFKNWCSNLDQKGYTQIYTKTEPERSDEEILKDMAELAKKHALQGTHSEQDEEYWHLVKEYISSVSPDRENALNKAMNEIIERTSNNDDYSMSAAFQQINAQITDEEEVDEEEPIDYFIELLKNRGKGKSSEGTISDIKQNGNCLSITVDHGGGMTTTSNYVNGELVSTTIAGNNYNVGAFDNRGNVENAVFYDDNGEVIAMFTQPNGDPRDGLISSTTKAELERRKEILAAHNAGHDFALGKYSPRTTSEPNDEVYNKTYEELRKATVA